MDLMTRRRALMGWKKKDDWTYVLLAEQDGRVEKAKIPLLAGQKLHMEWDYQNSTQYQCVLSFYKQINSIPGLAAYPIIGDSLNKSVFQSGTFDATMPADLTLFVGYWQDSDTADRRLKGDYIKIRIT